MVDPFAHLFKAFRRAQDGPPTDLARFLRDLPEANKLPSPWVTWTIIGLVRHTRRQAWVADVIRTRLRGNPDDLARLGSLGQPESVQQSGPVPGLPEWEYYFHGLGCRLTHKVRGEAIDVDFHDGDSAEFIDTYFYVNYLESLRHPDPAERRLLDLNPSVRPVTLSVAELAAANMLTPLPGRERHPFRIADDVLPHEDAIDAFVEAWSDGRHRVWLASLIGDWPAAHDAAVGEGRPDLTAVTSGRAGECLEHRRRSLLRASKDDRQAPDAMAGLGDLGADAVTPSLEVALAGPPSGVTSAALDVIERLDDPAWCPRVYALFRRVDPGGQLPEPSIWTRAMKFLLRHGHRTPEVIAALPNAGGPMLGEACLLALEHAPEVVLPLFRKALLSDIPANRSAVAAILALIDQPGGRQELLAALDQSDDQERTADARAALVEAGGEEARRVVSAWEEQNPHEPETGHYLDVEGRTVGPIYSMAEIMLRDRREWVQYEMDRLHDRVMNLRGHAPPGGRSDDGR